MNYPTLYLDPFNPYSAQSESYMATIIHTYSHTSTMSVQIFISKVKGIFCLLKIPALSESRNKKGIFFTIYLMLFLDLVTRNRLKLIIT